MYIISLWDHISCMSYNKIEKATVIGCLKIQEVSATVY